MQYNELGQEMPDPTPIAVPAHFKRPPSLQEQIKSLIRNELSQRASEADEESFEEADDFELDDDADLPHSMHEISEMQDEMPREAYTIKPEPQAPKTPPQASTEAPAAPAAQ